MKKLLLAGNATTAEILLDYLRSDPRYQVEGLVVDNEHLGPEGLGGNRLVSISEVVDAFSPHTHSVLMAMGYDNLNRGRESMFDRLKALGYNIETYIHPDAKIYTSMPIGEGSVVLPSAILEPFVSLGANTMVWSNVTLAHHSRVGDHCWVAAGSVVSGKASVMRNCFLGVNCTLVNAITVNEFNIVGAGALISRDTKPNSVHLCRSAEIHRFSSQDYAKHFEL
jgi:sugar O-acyltransferase (sialic acid O-acetyltransferase NeuD family)